MAFNPQLKVGAPPNTGHDVSCQSDVIEGTKQKDGWVDGTAASICEGSRLLSQYAIRAIYLFGTGSDLIQ